MLYTSIRGFNARLNNIWGGRGTARCGWGRGVGPPPSAHGPHGPFIYFIHSLYVCIFCIFSFVHNISTHSDSFLGAVPKSTNLGFSWHRKINQKHSCQHRPQIIMIRKWFPVLVYWGEVVCNWLYAWVIADNGCTFGVNCVLCHVCD